MATPDVDGDEDWRRLLAAQRKLQAMLPDAVLVGGTAAALHLRHRTSLDGDHVLGDLRERFDDVQRRLESDPSWRTARVQAPVLILGAIDGVPCGVRQLRRARPLETVTLEGLRTPSLIEIARVKAWLLLQRNTVRDYLDTVALLEQIGAARYPEFVASFVDCYARGPGGGSPAVELIDRLAAAAPSDAADVDLATYKGVRPPWNDLELLRQRGRDVATRLADAWTWEPSDEAST